MTVGHEIPIALISYSIMSLNRVNYVTIDVRPLKDFADCHYNPIPLYLPNFISQIYGMENERDANIRAKYVEFDIKSRLEFRARIVTFITYYYKLCKI